METKKFQDITLSRLGMGNMRLPMSEDGKTIDRKKAHEILDYAYEHGVNYYDTAYVYNGGDSEKCLGEWIKTKPRETFYVATKFMYSANPDYKAVFEEQLKRLQTDYIDFYLCHCLLDGNINDYVNSGCIEYFLEMKRTGKIKYLGFSSHSGVETLEKFADHHKWDFAQLQINYFDWNYSTTKKEYEILTSRNIPVIVMEPVRGGRLAGLTEECDRIFKESEPESSIASWAFKFVRSLDNAQVILSGMSNMDQIIENINTFSKENDISNGKDKIIQNVCEKFHSAMNVPCTKCKYCVEGCPKQIDIPGYISLYNEYKMNGLYVMQHVINHESQGKPWDCIKCLKCMRHCPQSINIPEIMNELKEKTEEFKNRK